MRYLGQHFLKNKAAIKKIVAALDLEENDTVIEIGPGHGELTAELLLHPIKLIAIERDHLLAQESAKKFSIFPPLARLAPGGNDQFSVIEGDALKIIPQLKIVNCKLKIVGNIPYYITGHLFRIIGELENKPEIAVFTVQKEVGERLTAAPPKMNRLAASVQIWADAEIIAKIPAKDFDPPPQVDSVIVKLKLRSDCNSHDRELYRKYYQCVRTLFQQPRKTLLNNLRTSQVLNFSKEEIREKLRQLNLSGEERPQNLSIEQIIKISSLIENW